MSKINDNQPQDGKDASANNEAKEGVAEKGSMFDSIKDYFKGTATTSAQDTPVTDAATAGKAVGGGLVTNGDEAATAAIAEALQGAPDNNGEPIDAAKKLDEGDKLKELTLEDIEKLEAAAAGDAQDGGFSVPETIAHTNRGLVTSLERDLGLNPFPPLEQKVLTTVLPIESTRIDNPVQILDLTPQLLGGDAVVNENDLLANRGPNESDGSDTTKESTTVPGDFKIVAPDGVDDLTVGGQFVIQNGVFAPVNIVTPLGNILSITGYNPATGVVTYEYTLLDNGQHANADGKNSIFENFAVHLSDADGDTADGMLSINVIDDVPSISVSEELASLIVDESFLAVDATTSFANLFNAIPGADGATIVYQLSISQEGADSGIKDTFTNSPVLLFKDGDDVVGRVGNLEVFRISVDPNNGEVTLDQSRAVVHDDPTDPDEANSPVMLSSNDLIKLTATITDSDGDVDSATRDIGNAFKFEDDGPTISVTLNDVAPDKMEVDETDFNINATANFSDNFNILSNFGADGPGTLTSSYALTILNAGADSGLDDTLTNQNVLLFLNGSVVEGRTAISNDLVFTVSVDNLGNVTLDGIRSVEHPNQNNNNDAVTLMSADLIKLIRTDVIVDKDGDSAQSAAALNIGQALSFRDDGPNIDTNQTPAPVLVVDESNYLIDDSASFAGLFTSSFGADGPKDVDNNDIADADAITYQLGIFAPGADSGLKDTATGENILLTLEADSVVGRAGLGGPIVFTISVEKNSGLVTLNQSRAVVHDDPNDPNEANSPAMLSEDKLINLTATIRDGDLDSDSATRNIGQSFKFQDDGPIAVEDCFDVPLPVQPKYNLTFVLDISGSMGTVLPNTGGKTRLQLLKEALTSNDALLDSYQAASSDLRITIVTFNAVAQTSMEFSDVAAAKAFINGLNANGTTNYQAAANAATADVDSDDLNASLNGFIDRLYWLSDGEPFPTNTALTDAQESAWRTNLIQGNVEAFMLNIGGTNANINENLADLDDDQPGNVITVAPDLSNLQQLLIDTISQSEVQGNVLANDFIGADVNPAVVNIYFFLADATAANAYIAAHPELIGASASGNQVTIPIPNAEITTPLGNLLHIKANGDFTYTTVANNDPNKNDEDTLYYTMRDGDGDRSAAEICFEIDLGVTITNLTPKAQGGDVTVDEDDLLANRGLNESVGSDTTKESTTQPGNFNISAPNGVDDVTVGGQPVITNGVFTAISFTTPLGNILNITGYNLATGVITYEYTLVDNEAHPNANGQNNLFEDFQVTLTDTDGDSASATLSARIIDDVPSITILPVGSPATLVVDETNLAINASANYGANFAVNSAVYGADGAGSQSSAYSLSLLSSGANSGLVDVATGQAVSLFMNGNVVEGRISGGTVVFTVSVNAAGNVTLDQIRAIKHPNASNPDDAVTLSATDLIKLTRTDTIIDADGDSANSSAVINIGQALSFKDDGPSYLNINDPDHDSIVEVKAFNPASNTTHSVQLADWSFGADNFGSLPSMNSSSGSGNVVFNAISAAQVQYKFYEGSTLVATLTLNANGTDNLELANRLPLFQEDTLLTSEAKAGGPGVYFVDSTISPILTIRITGNDNDGKAEPTSDDQVNPSNQGWAVANNIIEVNESIKFESLNENTFAPIPIFNFSFLANGFTGGQSSYDIKVKVTYSNSTTETFTLNVTSGQVVSVKDLPGFKAGSLINAVEVFNNDNTPGGSVGFRLNGVKIVAQSSEPPPDLDYNFSLKIVDKDGDSALQNFSLHLDGDAAVSLPGYTVDGPIVSATIFQDLNLNAVVDSNEANAISGDDGSYHLMAIDTNLDGQFDAMDGRLVSVGGVDSETGLSYDIPLFAPVGSSIISPLTSILQMQLEKKVATDNIMAKINQALGIAPLTDLTHLNPLLQAHNGSSINLMQAAAIMTLSVQITDALSHILKVPAYEVADEVYLAIGNSLLNLPADATADFKDLVFINSVISEVNKLLGLTHNELAPIADVLEMSQAALQASLSHVQSDPVDAISAVQTITQGQIADMISSFYNGEISEAALNKASHDLLAGNAEASAILDQKVENYSVTSYDSIQANDEKVTQISLHTDNAKQYIEDNGLDKLHAMADDDGKNVHIPVPQDGSEIEFTTPMGGSLAVNHSGEYAYSVNVNAQDQVEQFSYTLLNSTTGHLHQAQLDVNVFEHPASLVNLMGSDANDIMSSANHNANAIMMEGGKGINDFIIDVSDAHAPETIFIKDLGMSKQNILSFVGVSDVDHDGKVSFMDAVASFHQDGPNANLEVTLQNKTTVIFENVGTVPGHDMQALQQHFESITADLHVTK